MLAKFLISEVKYHEQAAQEAMRAVALCADKKVRAVYRTEISLHMKACKQLRALSHAKR